MGKVGIVRPLRGEAAPVVCYQPRAPLLRVDLRKRRRRTLGARASVRGRTWGGRHRQEALWGFGLPRGGTLGEELAGCGVLLATEKADKRPPIRQQVEVCFAALKCVFGMDRTLAKTLTGLVTRIAAKVTAYTYGFYVNRLLCRPQGRIKELWA